MAEYALRLANGQDTAPRVRASDALGLTPNGAVRARGGLRPDGGGAVTVVTGAMQVQVSPFSCWVDASPTGQVGYPFVCDATKTLTIDPGDATQVRVDTVAVVVKENAYDGSGTTSAVLQIVKGTPGAGAPAMPSSACIPLRDISVPAGASVGTGGLSSGNLSTDRRKYTVAAGGILPVATQAERDALTARAGQHVYRMDTGLVEVYSGTAWGPVQGMLAPHFRGYNSGTAVAVGQNIAFATIEDTDAAWGGAAYTVKRAGIYRFSIKLQNGNSAITAPDLTLNKGGTNVEYLATSQPGGAFASFQGWGEYRCAVGDVMSVRSTQAFTPNGVGAANPSSVLAIDWLRP